MSVNLPDKLKPSMGIAIDMLVTDPEAKIKDVAEKSGVTSATIHNWLKDPEFVEVFYQKYMVTFGAKLPNILNSMIREAEAGNVQAGRLVLEHSGKLVKNVHVQVDSPFEKFLKAEVESDEVEVIDAEEIDFKELPERNPENDFPKKREKKEKKNLQQAISKNKKKDKQLNARKERYQLLKRAKDVGLKPLPPGRWSKGKKEAWLNKLKKLESK